MVSRVVLGLRAVDLVASRADPFEPVAVGNVARAIGTGLSSASRLCAELSELGLLDRAGGYGAYRIGREAVRLSGRAAAAHTRVVRFALTRVAQETGETVFLAAPSPDGARVVSVVESPWTLHAPAELGERLPATSAAGLIAQGAAAVGETLRVREDTSGRCVEVAVPISDPGGRGVAVMAVRMPVYRAKRGRPTAVSALASARRVVERTLAGGTPPTAGAATADGGTPSALRAVLRMLQHLATGHDTVRGVASGAGLRPDRARRLMDSCAASGLVMAEPGGEYALSWALHGWYRAATPSVLTGAGAAAVREAAAATGVCAFLTVLKGMRSFTLVEELVDLGEGLRMRPWLGRPHPIVGSDGGPTLVMDLSASELSEIFPSRHTPRELEAFVGRVDRVVRDGVLSVESIEEFGITSISAPVRDASGTVAAAACLVGATETVRPRRSEMEAAARTLAARVTALLV